MAPINNADHRSVVFFMLFDILPHFLPLMKISLASLLPCSRCSGVTVCSTASMYRIIAARVFGGDFEASRDAHK